MRGQTNARSLHAIRLVLTLAISTQTKVTAAPSVPTTVPIMLKIPPIVQRLPKIKLHMEMV